MYYGRTGERKWSFNFLLDPTPSLCYGTSPTGGRMDKDLTFRQLQKEQAEWVKSSFGEESRDPTKFWYPVFGAMEELGELVRAELKHDQGIRGFDDEEKYRAAIEDAVADVIIFLSDYCSVRNLDLQQIMETTWNQVKQRKWTERPQTG